MTEPLRMYLVDVHSTRNIEGREPCKICKAEEAWVCDDLGQFYERINCTTVDMIVRTIEDENFLFIVDDEGLLKDDNNISAIGVDKEVALVGSYLVCGIDGSGEESMLASLTDEQMEILERNTHRMLISVNRGALRLRYNTICLTDLEYPRNIRSPMEYETFEVE